MQQKRKQRNRKRINELGNTGKSWILPLCAKSRLPSVPISPLLELSDSKKKNSTTRSIYQNKMPIVPGRIQFQSIEDLNVNPKDLPPLHFLRHCFSPTLVNKTSPLTLLRPIQLCREFIFCLIDAKLIVFSEELTSLLGISKENLKLLQFNLPLAAESDNIALTRTILLPAINGWLRDYVFLSQYREELSSLSKQHPLFDADQKHVNYNLLVAYDDSDQRKVESNFFNAIKRLEGGKYMHSIVYLDCRSMNSFFNSSSDSRYSDQYSKPIEQQIYSKFLARASHSNLRHNDLVYVDFQGCNLSHINPYRLVEVLQDTKCQKYFKDIEDEEKRAKIPKISIAFLSLENVVFQSKTQRKIFLCCLLPLFLDENFYFLDLYGWDFTLIKECFRSRREWLTIESKCCY